LLRLKLLILIRSENLTVFWTTRLALFWAIYMALLQAEIIRQMEIIYRNHNYAQNV